MRTVKNRRIPAPRAGRGRIEFSDFSAGVNRRTDEAVLSFKFAAEAYNYRVSGGALTTGPGAEKFTLPDGGVPLNALPCRAVRAWHFRKFNFDTGGGDDCIVVLGGDGFIYYKRLSGASANYVKLNLSFASAPSAVNYRLNGEDVLLFCRREGGMFAWDGYGEPVFYPDAPPVTGMAVHYERLFVTTAGAKSSVWFSDDLNPVNFNISSTEAGFIDLVDERGDALTVVSFLDYLYVFREYGISRITAYGDQSQFSAVGLFTGGGRIYADTVTVCGDRIYFLASDGLYVFDGISAFKAFPRLDGLFKETQFACGAFFNGRYYLSCGLSDGVGGEDGGSSGGENTLLEIDVRTGGVTAARGINAAGFCPCRSASLHKLLFTVSGGAYENFVCELSERGGKCIDAPLRKCWRTPFSDFGRPEKDKLITAVTVSTKYDCAVRVFSTAGERTFALRGRETPQRLRVNLRGRRAGLEFLSFCAEAEIARPVVEYRLL